MSHNPLPAQRKAIEARMGPVLVIAGPGAGKTFCLIERVGFLVHERQMMPERICAVTFTNKAAEEIAVRLKASLGQRAEDVTRGTLHSLCVGILREYSSEAGLQLGFGIADQDQQHHVLRRMGVNRRSWMDLLSAFGRHRLQGASLDADEETLFVRYQAMLARSNVVDFDDIISRTARLFRKHPEITQRVGTRWDYLLVDEFQDLNNAQYFVLQQLAQTHRNFFAVGDEEQSIFSWTGADPMMLVRFQADYGIVEPIVLDNNRRCSRQIFETARRLLSLNPQLFDKQLTADRESEHDVAARAFENDVAEVSWIIDDIREDRANNEHLDWGDYALLYRKHRVGEMLERSLVRAGVPCRLARGRSLVDDRVIKYLVISLQLVTKPGDLLALEVFAEQVLPESLIAQVSAMAKENQPLLARLRLFARGRPRSDPDAKKAWRFIYHIENLDALYRSHDSLVGFVEELLAQRVGKYRNALEERHDELSDPADDPNVVELADLLTSATRRNARVVVQADAGLEIALRGMLRAAGMHTVVGQPSDGLKSDGEEVVVTPAMGGMLGLPLALFKALQLVQSRGFEDVFEDFVAFDLETTDKDADDCDIIEIGAVRVRGGEVVDQFHSLVHATRPISSGAREVHGYTDRDLEGAPLFAEVWPEFRSFVGDDTLVAHNAQQFDVPVLRRAAKSHEGAETLVFFDTLPLARSLYRDSARLVDLAHRFGLKIGRAHHALDDALTLARVCRKLGEQKVVRSRKSVLVNLLDYLGLAIALDGDSKPSAEPALLLELARPFALGRFSDCLDFYAAERDRVQDERVPTLDDVIRRLGGREVMDRIRATKDAAQRYPEAMARLEALLEASRAESLEKSVEIFLERVALSTSQGAEIHPHRVNLLTLHSTKGLEFSRVYVVGVEDYQLPGYYETKENRRPDIEEARRLLYVGMTRAEDRLVLTRADMRGGMESGGSQFLDEMALQPEVLTTSSS